MIIDLIVGGIVLISAFISFLRGLIREVLTIAGVVGGGLAAIALGPKLSPVFRDWLGVSGTSEDKLFDLVPMGIVADICAYGSIFIIVVIILSVISHLSAGAIKAMGLGPIDRTLGVLFGIVRAVILLGLFYLPFHLLMDAESKTKYFGESRTHAVVEKTANIIAGFLPSSSDVQQSVHGVTNSQIKEQLMKNKILSSGEEEAEEESQTQAQSSDEEGYKQEERNKLDDLMLEEPAYNE
ncbi:MAG: CvpA family protein [Alphaproteobacteria bacterium]|nr:CvpA family protein [Alphaproteobacteria bacterium]